MKLYIIMLEAEPSRGRMKRVLEEALSGSCFPENTEICIIKETDEFFQLSTQGKIKNSCIIFAIELNNSGMNIEAYRLLGYLQNPSGGKILSGCIGGLVVDGAGSLYTKDMAVRTVFAANTAGCTFPGKPLTEATGDLSNLKVLSAVWQLEPEKAYVKSCRLLMEKVICFTMPQEKNPEILAIHAGNRKTSNSLSLWEMTAVNIAGKAAIEEISIRNGEIWDCRGCKYEACLHFGENAGCFYGGVMVEKVYPAILKSNILVLICPNYNDAVSANIMAFINRLTALFRTHDFSRKRVYAIVVSGYSGGDIVARQIISAVNMNKNFILPAGFVLTETANNPGDIFKISGIEKRAEEFSKRIISPEI